MKRTGISFFLALSMMVYAVPSAVGVVTSGTKCSKAGIKQTYKGKIYTCIKLGSKLYWNNGVAKGKIYEIGDTGPGGGVVFYREASRKSWGQYLEVAPQGWSGSPVDPISIWCDIEDTKILDGTGDLLSSIGNQFGDGKRNTETMAAYCSSGAFIVNQYTGGGVSDWYLPSKMELNQLCRFARSQTPSLRECNSSGALKPGFSSYYWSSSEVSATKAWDQFFNIGNINLSSKGHPNNSIRPIRAF